MTRKLLVLSILLAFFLVSSTQYDDNKRDVDMFGEACVKVGGSCRTQQEQQGGEQQQQPKMCEPASLLNQDCPNGAQCCIGREKGETERVEREAQEKGSGRDKNKDKNFKKVRKQGKMNQKSTPIKQERKRKGAKENRNKGTHKEQKKTKRKQNTRTVKKSRPYKEGAKQKQGKEKGRRRQNNRKNAGKVDKKAKKGLKAKEGKEIRKHNDVHLTKVSHMKHRKKCKGIRKCKVAGGKCKRKDCRAKETFMKGLCRGDCYCCVKGCKTKKGCKKAGGSCVRERECGADSKVIHKGCKGGCVCCVKDKVTPKPPPPPSTCEPKDKCKDYRGTCKPLCQDTEVVVHDACRGQHCYCCAKEENIGCPASTECPGRCSNTCTGVVANITCPGLNCLCCLDCEPKPSCREQYGSCKSQCVCGEEELVGGCSGNGCKCCVASIPTCTGGCNNDKTCEYGPLCTTTITVNPGGGSGCYGHEACGCCSQEPPFPTRL